MTNEVAIKAIQDFIGWFKEDSLIRKALKMAIQALSQEPTEKPMTVDEMECEYEKSKALFHKIVECEDAISREAVDKAIYDYWADQQCPDPSGYDVWEETMKVINKLPSVQPSRKGHWIKKEDDTCWWYVCSECEQEPLKNRWNDDDVLSTFCPNCGARMESGDKE